ncbi:hypothetical protein C488_09751 [Natrinema pellirubrum DSM 15624]|uniref:Uncharacterized protein n=1 Tax=Natrinema pellirubrum (strain DSM 15624 / CIP 106293 / JCM 10476 / NCIMB 786 / 157) TaxID=797303 RepID=L9YPA8_NATP1|nr:hypothetical protein C488_09751 [Natrinema pellirubrum DSM 15624]
MLLGLVLVVTTIAFAGCVTQEDYSTSVGEPTNGTVIRNVSVYDVNEIDGARYELDYRLDDATNYTLETYERTNGTDELVDTTSLAGREPTKRGDLAPPWDPGDERTYRLVVVRSDTGATVDAVTITIERN